VTGISAARASHQFALVEIGIERVVSTIRQGGIVPLGGLRGADCTLCALSCVESQSRIREDVMRRVIMVFIRLVLASRVIAQNSEAISGEWLITRDAYGNPLYQRMTLTLHEGKLTGVFDGDKLEGTLYRNALHFIARDEDNNTSEVIRCVQRYNHHRQCHGNRCKRSKAKV
jgi:hypothetical protein